MDRLRHAIETAADVAREADDLVRPLWLRRAGLTRGDIDHLIGVRHLRRALHGIYLVGASRLTQRQLHRLAEMRIGEAGALTALTGLELRSVLYPRPGVAMALSSKTRADRVFQTLVPMQSGRLGTIIVRRIDEAVLMESVDGLRLTRVGRSLSDLVRFGDGWLLNRAWKQAEFRGLLDRGALEEDIGNGQREGASEVAALLASRRILTDATTDIRGKTELPWLHIMIEAGLPMPLLNAPVVAGGTTYFADFLFHEYGVALELDSPEHLTPVVAARDHARDSDFDSVGLHTLRFIDTLALADPEPHLARLRDTLRRRGWKPT